MVTHPFPDGTFDSAVVLPLGWLDDRHQLLQVRSAEDQRRRARGHDAAGRTDQHVAPIVGSVDASIAGRVSLAVDLVPDLDGTSSQELTHDFPAPAERDVSWIIGLGVAAAIAVLLAMRWLWRRLAC